MRSSFDARYSVNKQSLACRKTRGEQINDISLRKIQFRDTRTKQSRRRKKGRKEKYVAKEIIDKKPCVESYDLEAGQGERGYCFGEEQSDRDGCCGETQSGRDNCCGETQSGMHAGTRYNGICNSGWSISGDRHNSDNGIPSKIAGTLGCNSSGNIQLISHVSSSDDCKMDFQEDVFQEDAVQENVVQKNVVQEDGRYCRFLPLKSLIEDCVSRLAVESGQSTVEYALVLTAFLGVVVALGLLMGSVEDGLFVEHAVSAASHNVEVLFGGAADVFSY